MFPSFRRAFFPCLREERRLLRTLVFYVLLRLAKAFPSTGRGERRSHTFALREQNSNENACANLLGKRHNFKSTFCFHRQAEGNGHRKILISSRSKSKTRMKRCFSVQECRGPKIISHVPHEGKGLYTLSANQRVRSEIKDPNKCVVHHLYLL